MILHFLLACVTSTVTKLNVLQVKLNNPSIYHVVAGSHGKRTSVSSTDLLNSPLTSSLTHINSIIIIITGELCSIVGRVSMDSITVRLPEVPEEDEVVLVVADDFDPVTSAAGMARNTQSTIDEIPGTWSTRLARVFSRNGKIVKNYRCLEYSC